MSKTLEEVLGKLGRARREEQTPPERLSAAAFRAAAHERLTNLERQLDEVKGRVNGLIFLLAGTVAVQVVLKLLE